MAITIGGEADPFNIPVSLEGGIEFKLQVHRLSAGAASFLRSNPSAQNDELGDLVKKYATPQGAADGASQEDLFAVYMAAMQVVRKANESGNA